MSYQSWFISIHSVFYKTTSITVELLIYLVQCILRKMSQTQWLTSLLLIVIISLVRQTVKSDSHLTIRPTESDPSFCRDNATCNTLNHFISTNPEVFSNNVNFTVKFLPGIHTLVHTIQLIINGSKNVSWCGSSSGDTLIICRNHSSFLFWGITLLNIRYIKFSNCGHYLGNHASNEVSAALILIEVNSFHMQNVVISHSRGYGLFGINVQGKNSITSCSFLENKSSRQNSVWGRHFVNILQGGGNAVFYFKDNMSTPTTQHGQVNEVSLSIKHSIFEGGENVYCTGYSRLPQPRFKPESYLEYIIHKLRSHRNLKTNGLALWTEQTTFQVVVQVANTNFSKNIGTCRFPAVSIEENSAKANNTFEFVGCSFRREGTLQITSTAHSMSAAMDYWKLSTQFHILVRNCTFINSSYIALSVNILNTDKIQQISIINCTFTHYTYVNSSSLWNPSVIIINITCKQANSESPNRIITTIENSHFLLNTIPALSYKLDKYCVANTFKLRNNYFIDNFYLKSPTVIIRSETPTNWETVRFTNDDRKVSRVYIFMCYFRNNTISLEIQNLLVVLFNSTFELSMETALFALSSVIHTEGYNLFRGNNGTFGGAMYLKKSRLILKPDSHTLIINNSAVYGGGIYAQQSVLQAEGFSLINGSKARFGGAIYLNMSQVFVKTNSYTLITNNYALYGGGIYAMADLKNVLYNYNRCTLINQERSGSSKNKIEFTRNDAKYAGNSLFGGTYFKCQYFCTQQRNCSNAWSHLASTFLHVHASSIGTSNNTETVIPPTKLCICNNESPLIDKFNKCYKKTINLEAFSGQIVNVSLIAIGEPFDRTSNVVVSGTMCKNSSENVCITKDKKNEIGYGQRLQEVYQQCTDITYTVNSQSDVGIEVRIDYEETANIIFEGKRLVNYQESEGRILIKIKLSPCPPGFVFQDSNSNGQPSACKCLSYFASQGISCNANNGTVVKPQNKWIFDGTSTVTNIIPTLINKRVVHNRCPYDYCIHEEISINLSNPNEQCNFKRSGILCGACQTNLSVVLGTSNCRKCSNTYLLLIIPFALAGVALVVLLLKCNLTVSVGHINGIIFYANIVQVNKALLFPNQNTAFQIFSTLIAWLNLDLGIESCFSKNMDTYTKTWLQFAFPVYLWTMVGLIIIAAHYSSRMGRLIGSNSVPVLATLFLLSYAKLLRTIIAAVSFTFIDFEDKSSVTVWLADGNVKYLSPKHVALFSVAFLFTLLYILPLTLLVLLGPCLQARSHYTLFKSVNRLKPFLDAYQGPYRNKFRHWTGILLTARLVLFVIYAANYDNNLAITLFFTIVVTSVLAAVLLKNEVYRYKLANSIELLSLLNILTLCSVNWLANTVGYTEWYPVGEYTTYISVAMTTLGFLGTIVYQLLLKVCPNGFIFEKRVKSTEEVVVQSSCDLTERVPTSSVVELANCEMLTEPLLEAN